MNKRLSFPDFTAVDDGKNQVLVAVSESTLKQIEGMGIDLVRHCGYSELEPDGRKD